MSADAAPANSVLETRLSSRESCPETRLALEGRSVCGRGLGRGDMTFKVKEVFGLLFGSAETQDSPPLGDTLTYEDRRWFRTPRPPGLSPDLLAVWKADAAQAENILLGRVAQCLGPWRERLGTRRDPRERISDHDSHLKAELKADLDARRHLPPRSPYDVFAICAYLIEEGGIYHHIQPEKRRIEDALCPEPNLDHRRASPRSLEITEAERDLVRNVAQAWRNLPRRLIFGAQSAVPLAEHMVSDKTWEALEPLFESWAIVFNAYADADVFLHLTSGEEHAEPAPGWWRHVWRLFAIADEAAHGTGFSFDGDSLGRALRGQKDGLAWFEAQLFAEFAFDLLKDATRERRDQKVDVVADITTLSVARSEMVNVLPKVRTPSIGCTLRSLSHHLSLLPGRGIARGRWTPNFVRPARDDQVMPDGQMNILLVPFPYSISADCFCGSVTEAPPTKPGSAEPALARFGYFDVHQRWLSKPADWDKLRKGQAWEDELPRFLKALIESARSHVGRVHAVVFPELALDDGAFDRVREFLRKQTEVEVLIAGVSGKRSLHTPPGGSPTNDLRHGNFVASVSFNRSGGSDGRRQSIREKHHRWKLDKHQLRGYGLQGMLSPELQWWENISLQNRRVDFSVIRKKSVISAMICEDLARVDPCQQILRSVAPNLVVALLMDAPQRSARWPSRYATVLAEDPGCAVLTMTSRGLMTRQHRLGLYPSKGDDRIVAMWRDDQSDTPVELNCPYDAQAVMLSVVEEKSEDISLDGRSDDSAMAFRYAGHLPVRIPDAKSVFADILGPEDRAC